jgi:hypothetical protein
MNHKTLDSVDNSHRDAWRVEGFTTNANLAEDLDKDDSFNIDVETESSNLICMSIDEVHSSTNGSLLYSQASCFNDRIENVSNFNSAARTTLVNTMTFEDDTLRYLKEDNSDEADTMSEDSFMEEDTDFDFNLVENPDIVNQTDLETKCSFLASQLKDTNQKSNTQPILLRALSNTLSSGNTVAVLKSINTRPSEEFNSNQKTVGSLSFKLSDKGTTQEVFCCFIMLFMVVISFKGATGRVHGTSLSKSQTVTHLYLGLFATTF